MENQTKIKAYSYIRMSTDIQIKGDSLRRQKELSKNYAEEYNLELIETIEDIGVSAFSGKNSKKGALGIFLDAIESNKIAAGSFLLVESLDRLSRESVLTAFNLFTSILNQHITIVTLTDNQIYTIENVNNNIGLLFTSLGVMLRANEESQTKSKRLKATWSNKRNSLNTKKYTGIAPAWLIYDKKLDVFGINNDVAKSVKKIFEMSINGYGAYSITTFLNTHLVEFPSYKSKNGWHKSYVQKILNNKAVYGEFQAHKMNDGKRVAVGNITEDYFPSIISKEDFELSQLRLKQRAINGSGRKGNAFANLFTKLIKCKGCGSVVVFRNKGKPPKGVQYLKCGNSERKLICMAPAWEYENFENSFFEFIVELDLEEIFSDKESLSEKDKLTSTIGLLKMNLETTEKEYELILDLIVGKKLSENIILDLGDKADAKKNEANAIKAEITKLNQSLFALEQSQSNMSLKDNIVTYKNIVAGKAELELKEIRHNIHNEIKKIITRIDFYNLDIYSFHVNLDDMIFKEKFINALIKKRYKTPEQQEKYLETDAGNRFYNSFLRGYMVVFTNGCTKWVAPSWNVVIKRDSRRLNSMIEKSLKNMM